MYHNEGLLFFIGTFYITFVLVLVAVMIVGLWRIFTKAGEKGWKSLIPIYNGYIIITRIARKSSIYFWGPILGSVGIISLVIIIVGSTGRYGRISNTMGVVLGLIIAAFYIGLFVITVLLNLAIAKNFGQSAGFAVGLILLPFIFYLILAFGDSKFIYSNKKNTLSEEDEDEYEYVYVDEDE